MCGVQRKRLFMPRRHGEAFVHVRLVESVIEW